MKTYQSSQNDVEPRTLSSQLIYFRIFLKTVIFAIIKISPNKNCAYPRGGGYVPLFWVLFFLGGEVACICRKMGMCHYFGYFFGGAPGFLGTFRAILGFLGTFMGYSRIFGYHFLVKFDFFKNNQGFLGIDLDILLMTLWNVACRPLVSYFLHSDLNYSCKKE